MNADTVKLPQTGDRVRFRDNSVNDTGIVTEVLPDDFVNVRWSDVPIHTSHRMHELEVVPVVPTPEDYTQLLKSLPNLAQEHDMHSQPLMLILRRRVGEAVQIGPDIRVTIVAASNQEVRLGIVAPPTLLPAAEELHDRGEDKSDKDHISWR